MSIGKKIGGGFCAIIILTLVLGFVAMRAMNEGTDVSETIAHDRIPRLVDWSELENNLLNAAYYARGYFQNGDEAQLKNAYERLARFKDELAQIKQLNTAHYFEATGNAVTKAEKDIVLYEDLIRKNQVIYQQAGQLRGKMMTSADEALAKISQLIKTMGETQQGYINAGNLSAALQYAQNMTDAAAMYESVSGVLKDLLNAERNSDVAAFAKVQESLAGIAKKSQGIAGNLLRPECRDLFAETMKEYNEFAREADELTTRQRELADTAKQRYDQIHVMLADAAQMVETTTKNTEQMTVDAASNFSASTTVVTIMLLIVLVVGVLVAIFITRIIVKPLATTQLFAQDVAAGHMDKELEVHTTDETGKLADALRAMVAAL